MAGVRDADRYACPRKRPLRAGERRSREIPAAVKYHQRSQANNVPVASPLNVVVLAAGLGKRMRSSLPKVLHPLAGRPIVAYVIDAARTLSPRAIAVVVGAGAQAVRETLAAPDLSFVLQEPPRGTGDATRLALVVLPKDGVTLVTIGDIPLVPATALAELVHAAESGQLAVLTARVADPMGLGRILRDAAGRVQGIVEERDLSETQRTLDEINAGVMAAPTALLNRWVAALTPGNAQREYYLTDIVAMAIADGVPVVAQLADDERDVRGVNDRAQLAAVERILQARRAAALMAAGVSIADPARIDIRGALTCGRDVRIDVGCIFEGDVALGDDVTIGPYCVLRHTTIAAGTVVEAYSHLVDATVGAGCRIGPYARLRPGATLAADVHVGNFVEVKASALGRGAKANHLAYIGDTTVGSQVNFGAGSITANYDGANKHRTVIGDGASIGSNCVLVAPVSVGEGATIGAGSVIAQDARPGALTVARPRQVTVDAWKRPVKPGKTVP
ncbi:MAG: bifunctional UDP-N-acetylglucosamine diphosphorylase/glucosamine-1-phosphate N-acetyltransferase GlmU [Burkholderiales bacterium]|nr:bifunctional UDP-N-acetylglucosamine diphosphorylase/glucosamine-1-phosphate N-acetyltransferase GlmU [Burkholderiales bacterium]